MRFPGYAVQRARIFQPQRSKVVDAPVSKVWKAWTTPDQRDGSEQGSTVLLERVSDYVTQA